MYRKINIQISRFPIIHVFTCGNIQFYKKTFFLYDIIDRNLLQYIWDGPMGSENREREIENIVDAPL